MTRRPITWLVAAALTAGVAFGLYWFAPWRLFTDTTVNETLTDTAVTTSSPASSAASAASTSAAVPVVVSQGSFITHEHDTSGTVRLLRLPDGTHRLEIAALNTSDGPDLRVWLTDQQVVAGRSGWQLFDDGRYVELGKLKGNKGDQVYAIPAGTDLTGLRSVTIWCKRFSVSFGAAELAA
ncbi:DM13 domain-containing protein [Dactylosporangium aurantiacum]|uniref:DM13 domain-containing protein n=1 Tax=Dactylosporangium aurantiacum TaxID=35754 RepID=A0A9Q9MJ31_9ACTN|nr:DM13 domain-containing protein [Dactylosporangium aurantiacum]MDG6107489.1 DM13 domain-containing protein [Dactylosporangium aurantiacum]UWZ54281.1 DM13 domain-containing protein [Dactylosporangium aurantiacum]